MEARRRDVVVRRAAIANGGEGGYRPKELIYYCSLGSRYLVAFDLGRDLW